MATHSRNILMVTHVNVALYAVCFWVQIGTLPYLTKKLEIDSITFGYLQTTFAAVQLLGGPIFGRFGDLFGSKYALMLAFSAAFLSYAILGLATSVSLVFLSRLPSICMHAMHGAQMVVTDVTDANSRSDQLGRLGLSYGIGMVLGPVLGGLTVKYAGEQAAAFVAALGSVISLILVVALLPRTTRIYRQPGEKDNKKDDISSPKGNGVFNIAEIMRIGYENPRARALLFVKSISGIPIGVLHSMFSILALNHFHLPAEVNGYVLSYVGILSIISQGIIVGRVTRMGYGEWSIIRTSIFLICVSYCLLISIVTEVISFCVALLPMVVAGAMFTTVLNSMLTKTVPPQDTGTMLGISMAVNSLIRIAGPTIGGFMLEKYGFLSFGLLGIVFSAPLLYSIRNFS